MIKVFDKRFLYLEFEIDNLIKKFDSEGNSIKDSRNKLKEFKCNGVDVIIKSFKVPIFLNKIIYNFLRKGKAKRSFEHAKKLIENKINTPKPIAFYEEKTRFFLKRSFYVCEKINYDFSMRYVIENLNNFTNRKIVKLFVKFTCDLHKKNINFLDHSPGNTLIQKKNDEIFFYLVDLNRMKFKRLSVKERLINFSRLCAHTKSKELVRLISKEYSIITNIDENFAFKIIWNNMLKYRIPYDLKKKIKRHFKVYSV